MKPPGGGFGARKSHGVRSGAPQAFGEGEDFGGAAVRFPRDAAIGQDARDHAAAGAAEGLDAVAGLEIGGLGKRIDDFDHRVAVEDAGDEVGDGGHDLAPPGGGQFGEESGGDLAADVGEGVAVKEKEGAAAMALPQEV